MLDERNCGCAESLVDCGAWLREDGLCECLCHCFVDHEPTLVGVPVPEFLPALDPVVEFEYVE